MEIDSDIRGSVFLNKHWWFGWLPYCRAGLRAVTKTSVLDSQTF